MQYENEIPTTQILNDLLTSEKVARRQYDELLMFPEIKGFESDLLYIRNDEHEHEKILECILQRIGPGAATVNLSRLFTPKEREILPTWVTKPSDFKALHLTKQLGEMYEVILDRFGDEEDKAVRSYEDLLVKVQQSIEALKKSDLAGDAYTSVATPLMELERKVNKHLNEERVHLDVVDALREMFSGMKLGKVS
jgi:rubrerythrin